jgi:hypothetical protein
MDPEPDLDPGGPKTCGSSGSLTLLTTLFVFSMNMYAEALANPIKYQQNILEERARVRH